MTIYLPAENIPSFRQAFDEACDRILQNKHDRAFYALLVQLVQSLEKHPLVKDYLLGLENESAKKRERRDLAALEVIESFWRGLWKYNHQKLKHRKLLVYSKQTITVPKEMSYFPLYNRVLFNMRAICHFLPLCRFIEQATKIFWMIRSNPPPASCHGDFVHPLEDRLFIKNIPSECKARNFFRQMFDSSSQKNLRSFAWAAELLPSSFSYLKDEKIKQKFSFPGKTEQENQQNMEVEAEISSAFCWEKLRFLQKCHNVSNPFLKLVRPKGRWASIRETVWKSALERCEIEILLQAKMNLNQKPSDTPPLPANLFLINESQIHRSSYEKYLQSLKNHIHTQILRLQNTQISSSPTSQSERLTDANARRIEKENFVISHTTKHRAQFPSTTHQMVFKSYKEQCPQNLRYGKTTHKKIIKKHNLDLRSDAEKKSSSGRPSKNST